MKIEKNYEVVFLDGINTILSQTSCEAAYQADPWTRNNEHGYF